MKKKWLKSTLALLLTGAMVLSTAPTVKAEEPSAAAGTTYYVDSNAGSDENDGTSENKAFKTLGKVNDLNLEPGDQVLLKAGSKFEGQSLKFDKDDSGSENAPVIISTYGDVDADGRPVINTNGEGRWEQNYGTQLDYSNHKWHGTVSSCILIEDTEYIEISGLEMTNQIGDGSKTVDVRDGKTVVDYNNAYAMDRTGVAGVAKDNGTVDHIVLDDLYIHDVKGNVYNKHMCNGGIYFIVAKPTNEATTGIARYNDVVIRNCYLDTVNRWGIAVGYTYQHGKFGGARISDDVVGTYGSSNVVIENNYLNNVGGDAITTMYLDRCIVQYNVAENIAAQINTTDYSQQQPVLNSTGDYTNSMQGVGSGRVAAGIWPWKCKNPVFQFNECFTVLNAAHGNGDGQPWDADSGEGTLYQYNYSHSNTASTIMFCAGESIDTTFRYNISVNEDMGPLDPAGNVNYAHVYNNTFVIKEGINTIWYRSGGPVQCENNIFYFSGDTPRTINNWNPSGNKEFDNNLYYNVANYPNDAHAVKVDAGTQVFVDVESAPSAPSVDKTSRFDSEGNADVVAFGGLKLAANSPAINAGKVITDKCGYTESNTRDFFGETLSAIPEIGAAESDVVGDLVLRSNVYTVSENSISDLPKDTTVKTFLQNIIVDSGVKVTVKDGESVLDSSAIVTGGMKVVLSYEGKDDVTYTIVASSDNELKSSYYIVKESTIYVPFTDKNPTTVSELKMNLKVADTASIVVLNGDSEVAADAAVAAGMTVRIKAEDGTANNFTVAQKNEYNWTTDLVFPQQGNVWFGQQKNGTADWFNMTTVDGDRWPNWMVNTYYGPGVDDNQGTTTFAAEKHGLLSAPPSTDISTSMAFRAPKAGTVTFSVKDDEPYLRQDGNSGGTVTLSLMKNDEVIKSVSLKDSKVKAEDWKDFGEITVNRGDYVRVVAVCVDNPTKPSVHVTPNFVYLDKEIEDVTAPEAPTSVRFADVDKTSATVVWTASLDNVAVTGYNVYVDGEKKTESPVTDTTFALTGLTEATEYNVEVSAVDAAGNESAKAAATVITLSEDAVTAAMLQELVDANKEKQSHLYIGGWEDFVSALERATRVANNVSSTDAQIASAYTKLSDAVTGLVAREKYDDDDRFQFPTKEGESAVLEAEFATNWTNSNDPDSDPNWAMRISSADWASNGKFLDGMAMKDYAYYAYNADKAGTYTVTVTYQSGDANNANKIKWSSDPENLITTGTKQVDSTKVDGQLKTGTAEFEMVVTQAGAGTLVLTAPDAGKAPNIDKFVITAKELAVNSYEITAEAGDHGQITAEGLKDGKVTVAEDGSITFAITADEGYAVADVKVDGESVGARTSYTFKNVDADHTIEATFAFEKYTASNPFAFPTEKGTTATLEAEHATSIVDDPTTDASWPLAVAEESWASNGKYLNCMANNDFAYYAYKAEKAGTYEVTATYRSGDPNNANKLKWSESDGKITTGQITTPCTKENNALTAKTVKFDLVVTTAGAGTLVLTAPDTGKGPQLDKFEIKLVRLADEADLTALQSVIEQAKAIINATDKDKYAKAELDNLAALVTEAEKLTDKTTQAAIDKAKSDIEAQMEKVTTQYTITASTTAASNKDGSIDPEGTVKVYYGTEKSFVVKAGEGRYISSIVVDGKTINVENKKQQTVTFDNIKENHTVSVKFEKNNPFEDVTENDYFEDAVLWAVENEITNGNTPTTFGPRNNCTRAQVVQFLYKAAGEPDVDVSGPNPFSDVNTGGTFYNAIIWAKQNGITVGYTDGTFRPLDPVTRGEYIAFQYRAAGKPAVSFENPFSDIDSNHRFYDAIMWAAKNKIASGRNGKFLPDENCVRGQVVTFLYNAEHLSK